MTEESKRDDDDLAEASEDVAAPEQDAADETPAATAIAESETGNGDNAASAQVEVTVPKPSRAPLFIAAIAFLIALASAAGVGLLWTKQAPDTSGQLDGRLQGLGEQLSAATDDLRRNKESIDALQATNNQANSGLDAMRRDVDQRLSMLEAVPGRLSNIESSLSALQGISSGLRDTWLLSEAEYYLQIANAQLQLAGNAELAGIALELADERLASLGNPALTDVRRKVADERRELETMSDVDLEGAVLTLGSLADAIQTLPLKNDIKERVTEDAPVDSEQSGMARAMASLKGAMSDVISVRRSDAPVTPLLPPDAAYFLRNNLTLQLQTARLAMLRGEQTIFEESLADAADWVREYYDIESRSVASAIETINEVRAMELTVSKPDISGSLAALRQFISLRAERNRPRPARPAPAAQPGNEQ